MTRRVQLKRTRCRENGFVGGKNRFQLCFVDSHQRRDIEVGVMDRASSNWRSRRGYKIYLAATQDVVGDASVTIIDLGRALANGGWAHH